MAKFGVQQQRHPQNLLSGFDHFVDFLHEIVIFSTFHKRKQLFLSEEFTMWKCLCLNVFRAAKILLVTMVSS